MPVIPPSPYDTTRTAAPQPAVRSPGDVVVDELLEVCLEQLVHRGPLENPADLRSLLPESDDDVRQFALIELIKLDMAMAAETGKLHRIERYADALPDLLSPDSIPIDLVMEEIQLRKESGESPPRDEYLKRFPQFAGMLSQLSGCSEVTSSRRQLGAPPELEIGKQIDDFLLIQKLGQGAFAHVYLARQISMHRLVALKVSRGRGDEPKALSQFDHPNIVRVYDQRESCEDSLHLLYMQFHPGGTLADVVKCIRGHSGDRSGSVLLDCIDRNLLRTAQAVPDRSPVRDWISTAEWPVLVAWIGIQLARALQDAHHRDVLHRDVKPANVLLSAEGIPKLADFNVSFAGIAGRAGAAAMFGGSIGYMSPEHLRAISGIALDQHPEVGERADLYSLAVLLWELWQGQRPFECEGGAVSWSAAVAGQLASRERTLKEPRRDGSASERVLEKVLRKALSPRPDDRFADGAEMAGRLRLSLHPEAATLFDPGEKTFAAWMATLSPWVVACLVILTPNMVGGCSNYQYNMREVMTTDVMKEALRSVSWLVNLTFFPFAIVVTIWYARSVVRAVEAARRGVRVASSDLGETLDLGHHAAVIGGSLWILSGIVFPAIFWSMNPDFTLAQSVHLFISQLICGGVAVIYPFYGMALLSSLVFYPHCLSGTMQDNEFDQRANRMVRRSEAYLLIAAIIPLLGAALLVSRQSSSKVFVLTAIGAGVMGLLASVVACRIINRTWAKMGQVLSTQTTVVPGEE